MAKKASKSAIGIVNAITQATNAVAAVQLPFVDKATFSDFGKQLAVAPDVYRNGWIDNLINLCGLQIILGKRMYESYFKKLYREATLTENIALYMVDAIKAKAYDKNATTRILENEPPRVGTQYIQTVLKRQYQVTDIEDLLTSAFTSEGSFLSFMDAVTTQLYSSMEDDNVEMIKTLIKKNLEEGNIRLELCAKPEDKDGLLYFMQKVKTIGADWAVERSRKYNLAAFRTFSPKEDHYFLMNTEMDAMNEVYNLPFAFNQDYLKLKNEGEAIVMGSEGLGAVYAMMFDRDFMQLRDRVNHPRFTSFFNPATLSQNRFLTCFTVLGLSFFSNAVAFIAGDNVGFSSGTLATRDGSTAANPGDTKEIYVSSITPESGKYFDKFGTYHVDSTFATSADTKIDPETGVLTIGKDETGTEEDGMTGKYLSIYWTSHLTDESDEPLATVQMYIKINGSDTPTPSVGIGRATKTFTPSVTD